MVIMLSVGTFLGICIHIFLKFAEWVENDEYPMLLRIFGLVGAGLTTLVALAIIIGFAWLMIVSRA